MQGISCAKKLGREAHPEVKQLADWMRTTDDTMMEIDSAYILI